MRERFLVLYVLTLLPLQAYGGLPSCPTNTPEQNCWAIPGCRYVAYVGCTTCDDNFYCDGQHTIHQECPNAFPKSERGSTSITDCYKDTTNNGCEGQDGTPNLYCGLFYDLNIADGIPKCWNPTTGEYNNNYHIEPDNGNKCFSNTRNCNLFGDSGCDGANPAGTAEWNTSLWNIESCHCDSSNFDYSAGNCYANVIKHPQTQTTQSATDNITYTLTNNNVTCTNCKSGAYTDPNDNTKCKLASQGWYSPGCPINSCNGQPTKCPFGQTTDGDGAGTSATDCHYSNQTKFCDSKGCFNIDNIGAWNPS